jgi:hypothetical protein
MMISHLLREGTTDELSNSAQFLVSLLVCFPEVATVKFRPRSRSLTLSFTITRRLTAEEVSSLTQHLQEALGVYWDLFQSEDPIEVCRFSHEVWDELTQLHVERDVDSLTPGELGVLVGVLREGFLEELMVDSPFLDEDERVFQQEMMEEILAEVRLERSGREVFGFREEGRVIIANESRRRSLLRFRP